MSIEKIEGIGPAMAEKLKKAGIQGLGTLLKKGGTPKGREDIAEASGISTQQILKWVNMADLFRIKGVGSQYSELLEASGVDTVKELKMRNAENLHAKMEEVNSADRQLVRQLPNLKLVSSWIEQAKELPPAVSY